MDNTNDFDGLLSKRIRSIREQLGYSQQRLAELLGISRVTVSQMEAGKRKLSASDLKKLSDILEMPADYLLNPDKEPEVVIQEVRENEEPVQSMRVSVPQEKVDKFKEVLLYILNRVGAKPNVGRTVVYKLLYFMDFDYYEQYEEQLIGARYQKNQYGPTPMEFTKIVQRMEQDGDLTEVKNKYFERFQTKYLARRAPDLSVLSGQELQVIEDVLSRLSDKNGKEISAYSHGDVPWLATEDGQVIDYDLAFYRTPPYSRRQYTEDDLQSTVIESPNIGVISHQDMRRQQMDFKFDLSGLDELQRRVRKLDGSHDMPMIELLNPEFMTKHTSFSSFQDMLDHSGYSVKAPEDFKAIPDAPWDAFISANSAFANWHEMREAAKTEWAKKQLGL